jgi:polyisoprenoid-binding protein YceI
MTSALATLAMAALAQAPAAARVFSVTSASTLSYGIVHKLHKVEAVSHAVEGKVALLADGKVQVMVRAPVASFKSGDANRDEHMAEVTQATSYTHVTFKGVATASPPASFPTTQELALQGVLEFHGRKHPETLPLRVEWLSATEVQVKGRFAVSLDAYEVERPSLLFMKIEDACIIAADLALKEEGK